MGIPVSLSFPSYTVHIIDVFADVLIHALGKFHVHGSYHVHGKFRVLPGVLIYHVFQQVP